MTAKAAKITSFYNATAGAEVKIILFVLVWGWAAWVTVALYGCASRIYEIREMLKREGRTAHKDHSGDEDGPALGGRHDHYV